MQDLCNDGKLPGRQTGRLDQANLSGKTMKNILWMDIGHPMINKDQNNHEKSYYGNHVPYPS